MLSNELLDVNTKGIIHKMKKERDRDLVDLIKVKKCKVYL